MAILRTDKVPCGNLQLNSFYDKYDYTNTDTHFL